MALRKQFTQVETGAEFPEGYLRVQALRYIHGGDLRVDVACFKDEAARQAGKQPVGAVVYIFPMVDDQPLRPYAYAQLKAHPDFADAVDV
jgi:hypothetical protein